MRASKIAIECSESIRADLMRELREPSKANPGHGLAIWLNAPGGFSSAQRALKSDPSGQGGFLYADGEPQLFAALGAGANRMYMIPSRNIVVLRQTDREQDRFDDSEFLRRLLGNEK